MGVPINVSKRVFEYLFLPRLRRLTINGQKMDYLCSKSFAYFFHRSKGDEFWFENNVSKQFAEMCMQGDTVLDIGADHGFYSLLAATVVGTEGRVVAFEPHPNAADSLEYNLTHNDIAPRIETHRTVVSDSEGNVTFGRNSLSTDGSGELVPAVSIDTVCRTENIEPDVIKIDVEGAESLVLQGAMKILAENKPSLFIEVHSNDTLAEFESDQKEVYRYLLDNKYDIFQYIEESGEGRVEKEPPLSGERHHVFCNPA